MKREVADDTIKEKFVGFISSPEFPCLGAKAALNAGSYELKVYGAMNDRRDARALGCDLERFVRGNMRVSDAYATFVAIFRSPLSTNEEQFERLLWRQLERLHEIDHARYPWDKKVSPDPGDPRFSFSFAGQALYVVGLHGASARLSRRFPWPALVFNPHAQFEKLREDGKWRRMRNAIRARDQMLQGNINPMLADFGEESEARQYSGRQVAKGWRPPFGASTTQCPFAH